MAGIKIADTPKRTSMHPETRTSSGTICRWVSY
jgi:hypothetical protein